MPFKMRYFVNRMIKRIMTAGGKKCAFGLLSELFMGSIWYDEGARLEDRFRSLANHCVVKEATTQVDYLNLEMTRI